MTILNNERGQSLTEYILIIALVIIAVVISLHLFGSQVKEKFFSAGSQMQQSTATGGGSEGSIRGNAGGSSTKEPAGKAKNDDAILQDEDGDARFGGDEDAIRLFEQERQKAWLKTILVFAVAGAVLLMLIFMTIERIRLIKKQMASQQDMDDFRRGSRSRRSVTFKNPLKPKE